MVFLSYYEFELELPPFCSTQAVLFSTSWLSTRFVPSNMLSHSATCAALRFRTSFTSCCCRFWMNVFASDNIFSTNFESSSGTWLAFWSTNFRKPKPLPAGPPRWCCGLFPLEFFCELSVIFVAVLAWTPFRSAEDLVPRHPVSTDFIQAYMVSRDVDGSTLTLSWTYAFIRLGVLGFFMKPLNQNLICFISYSLMSVESQALRFGTHFCHAIHTL